MSTAFVPPKPSQWEGPAAGFTPPPPSSWEGPAPRDVGSEPASLGGVAEVMGGHVKRALGAAMETLASVPDALLHPLDAAQKAFSYTSDAIGRVREAKSQGDVKDALLSAVGTIPLAGAPAEQIAREIDQGNYAEAIGHAAALRIIAEAPGAVKAGAESLPGMYAERIAPNIGTAAKGAGKVVAGQVVREVGHPWMGVGLQIAGVKDIGKAVRAAWKGAGETAPEAVVADPLLDEVAKGNFKGKSFDKLPEDDQATVREWVDRIHAAEKKGPPEGAVPQAPRSMADYGVTPTVSQTASPTAPTPAPAVALPPPPGTPAGPVRPPLAPGMAPQVTPNAPPPPAAFMDTEATGVQIPQVMAARGAVAGKIAAYLHSKSVPSSMIEQLEQLDPKQADLIWHKAAQDANASASKTRPDMYTPSAETRARVMFELKKLEAAKAAKSTFMPSPEYAGRLKANPKALEAAAALSAEMGSNGTSGFSPSNEVAKAEVVAPKSMKVDISDPLTAPALAREVVPALQSAGLIDDAGGRIVEMGIRRQGMSVPEAFDWVKAAGGGKFASSEALANQWKTQMSDPAAVAAREALHDERMRLLPKFRSFLKREQIADLLSKTFK